MKIMQKLFALFLVSVSISSFAMRLPAPKSEPKGKGKDKSTSSPQISREDIPQELGVQSVQKEFDPDEYTQAHNFHDRLKHTHPEWVQDGTQAYYKKIRAITSKPSAAGVDEWYPNTVAIDGNEIMQNSDGVYAHNGISFDLNSRVNFDPNKSLNISIAHNNKSVNVHFAKVEQIKVPGLTHFQSYNELLQAAGNNKFSLIHKITLKGIVHVRGERPHVILIEAVNGHQQPIVLQGMQIVYNKDEGTTRIFFDFVDAAHEPVSFIDPIECKHTSVVADKTVFCIKDHKVYECEGKTIYNFFDSSEIRKNWAPKETDFYDQNNQCLTALPSCYSDADDHQETLKDPVAWVLDDGYDSLYQLHQTDLQDTNDYVYSGEGVFYALLPYRATCKEYLSQDAKNNVKFNYLVQVKKPHFIIHKDARIEGRHRDLPSGLYQRIRTKNRTHWQQVGVKAADAIKFCNVKAMLDIMWPSQSLSAQEVKQWGDAAQRFFILFNANINHCDKAISDGLKKWDKLNCLDLSHLQLAGDIKWNELFAAIGTMQQLTHLFFGKNHPVVNLVGCTTDVRDRAHDYYCNLAVCLAKLTKLEHLNIQGLWLKSHELLGSGYDSSSWGITSVSTEVAELTYIISYKNQKGVRDIITSICALNNLKNLSIDGISDNGHSHWAKLSTGGKFAVGGIILVLEVLANDYGSSEDTALKQLVNDSADQLAQMPSLSTISVYSPGGNCIDYFSKAFKDRLAATRTADQNLPPLTIKAEVLQ